MPSKHRASTGLAKLHVDISISADQFVRLYAGSAKDVFVVSREGVSIRFPGKILNRFVTRDGIYGTFAIQFDRNNKLVNIQRID